MEKIYASDAKEGFKVSFLTDIIDILEKLIRLESTFFHDMRRNPNFHSDLSDDCCIEYRQEWWDKMKRFRAISVYYRDENKVMRRIPDVKALTDGKLVYKVYTLPPVKPQEINLEI